MVVRLYLRWYCHLETAKAYQLELRKHSAVIFKAFICLSVNPSREREFLSLADYVFIILIRWEFNFKELQNIHCISYLLLLPPSAVEDGAYEFETILN